MIDIEYETYDKGKFHEARAELTHYKLGMSKSPSGRSTFWMFPRDRLSDTGVVLSSAEIAKLREFLIHASNELERRHQEMGGGHT